MARDSGFLRGIADALLHESASIENVDRVVTELESLTEVWRTERSFRDVVQDASQSLLQRVETIRRLIGKHVSSEVLHAFFLLIRTGRSQDLLALTDTVKARRSVLGYGVEVDVTSAIPISQAQQSSLQTLLTTQLESPVTLRLHVDSAVGGGLLVETPQGTLDVTIQGAMTRLKEQLLHTLS